MKIPSFFDNGEPDKLIDQLIEMSQQNTMQQGIKHIWHEFVPEHIAQLDCQFFDRFTERVYRAKSAGEKARLKNLLGMVCNAVVWICQEPLQELNRLIDQQDISEKDMENYLKTAETRYHFVLYAVVIFTFVRLYQTWEQLHSPDQIREGPILKMVVRVAGHLQPDAKKTAALISTAEPQ